MPMIQGMDAGALINAFRQGRQDRYSDEEQRMKIAGQRADMERKAQVRGLLGAIAGGQTGGIAGVYQQTPQGAGVTGYAPTAPKPAFDEAFSAPAMGQIAAGETPAVAAPAAPAPPAPQPPARAQFNQDLMRQLMVLDPETGAKLASGLKTMSETELKQLDAKNMAMAVTAHWLATKPESQRQQLLQIAAPQLLAAGWTANDLAQANLGNDGLALYQAHGQDMAHLLEYELKQREFLAGKDIPVVPGGNVAHTRPVLGPNGEFVGNKAEWIIGGGGQPTGGSVARPGSKAEYDALQPGSRYIAPDGTTRTKPGGGVSNDTGGFR